jgi:hypothetical protein
MRASAAPWRLMTRSNARGMEARFRVRDTPEWKLHTAELETEMLRRGTMFEVIDGSKDQTLLPFEK